jgi:hypothetical protein
MNNSSASTLVRSYIYLIKHEFAFKVGFSTNVETRIYSIQCSNYLPIQLVGYFEGSLADEQHFHREFKTHCLSGEWYPISLLPSALDYLRNMDTSPHCLKLRDPQELQRRRDERKIKAEEKRIKAERKRIKAEKILLSDQEKFDFLASRTDLDCFLDPCQEWSMNSQEVKELVRLGNHAGIWEALGFKPKLTVSRKIDGIAYLRQVLALVGLRLTFKQILRLDNGKRLRLYSIV